MIERAPRFALLLGLLAVLPALAAPPAAPVREVRETHHGVEVSDPYRWMEDMGDAQAQSFFRAQGEHARAELDRLPGRAEILRRIRELSEGATTVTSVTLAAGKVFYLKLAPGLASPVLCVRDGFAGTEKVLVDPARFSAGEARAAVNWFAPSPDGRHVAYGISAGGSEDATLRVADVASLRDEGVAIDRARFNSALAWHPDGEPESFYYARIPEGNPADPAKRYANIRIYRHVLGRKAAEDEIVFASGVGGARDVPEIVYPSLVVPEDSNYAYALVRHGVRREIAVHVTTRKELVAGRPTWRKIVDFADEVTAVEAWKDDLYLLTHKGAPRYKVLLVNGGRPDLAKARTIVPEGDAVIQRIALAQDALYLQATLGGIDRLERLNFGIAASKKPEFIRIPFDMSVSQLVAHPRRPGAVIRMQGWTEAPSVMQVEAKTGNLKNTGLQPPSKADYSAMDEVRLYAPGHDGTKIPVTLVYRKTTMLTAENPTLLVGYGSYGIPVNPMFDPSRLAWLERGGILAFAHVRGGGEYGEEWHAAGRGAKKINTILDFISCAEFLVKYGFTNPKRLAIQGTSAGGIPSGGALVRRPELFAAVVARVAVMDMLRLEFAANGPANIPEFGSIATAPGFTALHAMSSYHHVKDGAHYPAVLLTTGMNDPRVDPWQAGKMAARLQAATASGKPVLLRVEWHAGHGAGSTRQQREEELADIYSFLLWQFGKEDFAPR
jgi:prolyl oligopeptidase